MSQFAQGQLPNTLIANGQEVVGQCAICRVYWYNPNAAGDTFVLQTASGKLIVRGRCESSNQSQWFDFSSAPIPVNGYGLASLTSGQVDIYTI